jgi:NhaA family Na+:H+ antiporter
LWLAVLHSGVHATIAGVVAAMTIPARTVLNATQFLGHSRRILDHFERCADDQQDVMTDAEQQMAIGALEDTCEKAQPPLYHLETALHPWVAIVIMPVFAFANSDVVISSDLMQHVTGPITLGAALGLLLGKPIGIGLAAWLSVKAGVAALPEGVTWNHIHGAAWLGGIGFTMSLFVAALAFPDPELLAHAKTGVLAGSMLAALAGSLILLRRSAAAPAV